MANQVAPDGQVFVCGACGKRSKDRCGAQKIDPGWDGSCMSHAILCYEQKVGAYWRAVDPYGEVT